MMSAAGAWVGQQRDGVLALRGYHGQNNVPRIVLGWDLK